MPTYHSHRPFVLAAALLASLLLAGCSMFGGQTPTPLPPPQATATLPPADVPSATPPPVLDTVAPPPSETPAPTDTVEPSPTPSPIGVEVSPTPAVPATPDPNEAVGDIIYQDALDGSGRWFWTFADEVSSFGVDAARGQVKAVMSQTGSGWRFTISPDNLRIGSQQVRLTALPETCAENDEYGLMFRASADEAFNYSMYLFKLRCGGAARLDLIQGTQTTPLVDWTQSPAIETGPGVTNQLMVWMAGSEFRFYVNERYLFSAQDAALSDGFYGLYIYDRTAGGATVYFDDLVARAVNR
jgi:hypothetical protein